ncbi:eukaryotic translation initiation factor 3 subunit L-like [Ruditapes philippinarum]|uniref:eukaryotic translation initiation factor 3 subunit L-like n=1 Tax=Ruditapes philippinarum TaxID=129788 RepID=UPI00295AC09F|nr:eukaryotic translation initiation factor 3 subunit L-like [Ruditapes philippinarum]
MWSDQYVEDAIGQAEFATPYAYGASSAYNYEKHTGDPRQDMEYERQYQSTQSTFIVPDVIKNFLTYFRKCVKDQNVYGIQDAYENGFTHNINESSSITNSLRSRAEVFAFLIRSRQLMIFILDADEPVGLQLPNQWLWDIIDEFIYQFQSFSIYRCKIGKKLPDEIEVLRNNPKIWNVHSVLNVLHSLVEKSNINRQLEVYASGGDPDSVSGEFGQQSLYKMLGYFSLIGLLRLHSLLGDYYQALKVLENIDFNKKNMYSRVPACQITTFYYVGFAYMMMRRYQDAIRTFSNILLYIQRTKQMFQTRVQMYDQITKMNDKMYTLLAICLVLHPIRIDESVHSQLREKFADKMLRMSKADLQEFEQNFSFACPKFLSPVPPNYDTVAMLNFHKTLHFNCTSILYKDIIFSYLKLYTTLPIQKLAIFMDMSEEELKTHLMCFKHKMKNVVWTKGTSGLEGEFQSASEVDFYIDRFWFHIADTKVARRYGDFFIRQIHKFEEITRSLKNIQA